MIALWTTSKLHLCWKWAISLLILQTDYHAFGVRIQWIDWNNMDIAFCSKNNKPSVLIVSKYLWGFKVGFAWVQIVEVNALNEHYGWKTIQLFCSKTQKTWPQGICPLNRDANHFTCCNSNFSMPLKTILLLRKQIFTFRTANLDSMKSSYHTNSF